MLDLDIVKPGKTIRIPFSTFDKDDSSSITMTSYAVADILIYKDGSTTERASTSGFTATTDFDSKTGKHFAIIDLADNTTAGFFAVGSEYHVAIDAVTVDGVTVGAWIARFQIGYKESVIDTTIATLASQTSFTLTKGPAENDALNGHWAIIHDVASEVQWSKVLITDYVGSSKTVTLAAGAGFTAATTDGISIMGPAPLQPTTTANTLDVTSGGAAGIDWGNVENKTTANDLSATDIQLCDTTTTLTGHTVQTADHAANISDILTDTGTTLNDAIAVIDANVDQIETAVVTNATGADIAADIIALKAETVLILADSNELEVDWKNGGRLDLLLDAIPTTAMRGTDSAYTGTPPTVAQIQTELEENGASLLDTIRDELANGSDGLTALKTAIDAIPTTAMRGTDSANTTTPPTVAAIADAVWDETQSSHVAVGSFGIIASEIAAIPTTAMRGTDSAATPANVATALTDIHLDHLLAADYDPASKPGTSTALLNEIIESDSGVSRFTTNALEQAPSGGGGDATEAKQDTIISDLANGTDGLGALKTLLDAIPTTAMRGTDSAALASVCTETRLATCTDWINGGRLDLIVDAILLDTGTTLDSAISVIDTNVDQIEVAVITNAAGTDIAADIIAMKVDTAATLVDTAEIGSAGAGLSNIPWNASWDAEVESEVNDALNTSIAELGVAAPTATPTIKTALMLLYMALRNKTVVQTSGTDALEIYNSAGTKIAAKLLTDDGSDYTEAGMS